MLEIVAREEVEGRRRAGPSFPVEIPCEMPVSMIINVLITGTRRGGISRRTLLRKIGENGGKLSLGYSGEQFRKLISRPGIRNLSYLFPLFFHRDFRYTP